MQGGELDAPSERFAQGFPATKTQDISFHGAVIDIQNIAGLSVKKR